jgi:hypothetical protein
VPDPEWDDALYDDRIREAIALVALATGDVARIAKYLSEVDPISPAVAQTIAQMLQPPASARNRYAEGWRLELKSLKANPIALYKEKWIIGFYAQGLLDRGVPRKKAIDATTRHFGIAKSKAEQAIAFAKNCKTGTFVGPYVLQLLKEGLSRREAIESAARHFGIDRTNIQQAVLAFEHEREFSIPFSLSQLLSMPITRRHISADSGDHTG